MSDPTARAEVLVARGLAKDYIGGDGRPIHVLRDVDFTLSRGECVAIVGASGSGKSTLLHLLGALDTPTSGDVALEGQPYGTLSPDALATLRNRRVGFVFQFHHLLRDFSAEENVMMPLLIAGVAPEVATTRAAALLAEVGLTERASHRPTQLSGGEQQRVAVARALATAPAVLLADEPSGNLDPANAGRLHELLLGLARSGNRALVVVTHNPALAAQADRILTVRDGMLEAAEAGEGMAR